MPFGGILAGIPDSVKALGAIGAVFLAGFGTYAGVQNLVGMPTRMTALEDEVRGLRSDLTVRQTDYEGLSVRMALAEKALCDANAVLNGGPERDRYCEVVEFIHTYGVVPYHPSVPQP